MTKEQIEQKVTLLANRVAGINNWIRNNPSVTDPNAYEIMDCNIQLAELIAQLRAAHNAESPVFTKETDEKWQTFQTLIDKHPELKRCCKEIEEMDYLRDTTSHPFFASEEAMDLYSYIKFCQLEACYQIPEDIDMQRIKRETLCKAMSVAFYIWQVQRTEPEYQFDNKDEFEGMQESLALYEASENPCQFGSRVAALHNKINSNYKYAQPPQAAIQKEKK